MKRAALGAMALAGLVLGTACESGSTTTGPEPALAATAPASLVSVEPEGGATGVDPTEAVVVRFDHRIHQEMTGYAALHEGDINGPEVAGAWSLSEDGTRLTFTQDQPLRAGTSYTIHLGGGLMGADGSPVDMETHGAHMGGEWADGSMMNGGAHGGGSHGGGDGHGGTGHGGGHPGGGGGNGDSDGEHPHMGEGWEHPENGSYGMIFTFTTAGN